MRKIIFSIIPLLIIMVASAQTSVHSPVGDYYLRGVMETASGFRLNNDSSFEFFFSYGAVDRDGHGTWRIQGNQVIFDSERKSSKDYSLVRSEKTKEKGIVIRVTNGPSHIKSFLHAQLIDGSKKGIATANSSGAMYFDMDKADTIEIGFDLCSEKTFVYKIEHKDHNYFEFQFEPGIMDVVFDNFKLTMAADKLSGPHPLMMQKTFTYEKAKTQE